VGVWVHLLVGAGEVARESSPLITTVPDEGDGLALCEQLSYGYNLTHCCVNLQIVVVEIFLCHFIDKFEVCRIVQIRTLF